jgi:hypothetical protein
VAIAVQAGVVVQAELMGYEINICFLSGEKQPSTR